MKKVTVIVSDIKISEVRNENVLHTAPPRPARGSDIDMFTIMLSEPLYVHIFSCYTLYFRSVSHSSTLLHRTAAVDECALAYAIAAADRRKPAQMRLSLPLPASQILRDAGEADILAFASPFAFTLPDNVVYDALAAFFEPDDKHRADAVIVGSRKDPVSLFVRGDVYRAVTDGAGTDPVTDMRVLSTLLANKRPGADKATGTFASAVHQINCLGTITDRASYFAACEEYRREMLLRRFDDGVEIQACDGVMISPSAQIGVGTVIHPNTEIRSGCVIGENCVLGPSTILENCVVGDNCELLSTVARDAVIDDNVRTGPFCHLRPNTHLQSSVRAGAFVEIKNADLGANTHAAHLTYIGDSDVGQNVNFGCGTVTVNYDGKAKHRCTIGDNAFIGCNTNLIAPVTLGDNAYTAAGSTITSDVPPAALAIARSRQTNKENWNQGKTAHSTPPPIESNTSKNNNK